MAIPELEDGAGLTVGSKQTRLALEKGLAEKVFIARDAAEDVVDSIITQCMDQGVPVIRVASMRELGKACGIQVGAAAAAMVRK